MYKNVSPFSFFFPERILFQCKFWHRRKGVKTNYMLLGFFDLFFGLCLLFFQYFPYCCCLPWIVFLQYFQICKSQSPLCCVSGVLLHLLPCSAEISRALCSSVATVCAGPGSECFCCLFALCPEEPCLFSNNTQAVARLHMCARLISLIIPFHKTDSISFLIQGLQPLDPFACW